MEQIRGVTWDLEGTRLMAFQAAQYLYKAGFKNAKLLMEGCAIMGGESAWYTKAWHLNVVRDGAGNIAWDNDGKLTAKSCDMGWIQRNYEFPDVALKPEDVNAFVEGLFAAPESAYLGKPALAAAEAWALYSARRWQPWYAWSNGGYKQHLPMAGQAVANFLAVEYGLGQSFYTIRTR